MTATATEHHTLTLGKIAQHPHNPRRDVGDVSDLAASIKSVGILQDLTVAPWPSDVDDKKPRAADYVLIAGHRRLAAAKSAGLKQVPVKVIAAGTLAEQIEAMIVENLQRSDLTPVEEAHAYQELLDLKVPVKQIATVTGQTQTRVRDRLKLTRIPETVQDLTHAGQITLTDALAFDQFKDDPNALEELNAAVGTHNWSFALNRVREARERTAKFLDRVRGLEGKGVRFLTRDALAELRDAEGGRTYKGLDESLPGVDYVYPWDGGADARATKHAECPGHAALAEDESRLVRYYCLQPNLHQASTSSEPAAADGDTTASPREAQRQKEFEEAQQAREQARLDLEAAHRTRMGHLAAVVAAGPSDELVADCIRQPLLEDNEDGWWGPGDVDVIQIAAALFDIDVDWATKYDEDRADKLAAFWPSTLEGLTTAQVAVVIDVVMHAAHELDLTQGRWQTDYSGRRWITRLVDVYGYQLSEFERELLDANLAEDGEDE